MPTSDSILDSTKKALQLSPEYDVFDPDIIMHINTAFSTLTQLGVGPSDGYMIEDASDIWDDFLEDDPRFNFVKTYVYLRVRLLFDPPGTSFVLNSMTEQIKELEWRLSLIVETTPSTAINTSGGN